MRMVLRYGKEIPWSKGLLEKVCSVCAVTFYRYSSDGKALIEEFCSRKCSGIGKTKKQPKIKNKFDRLDLFWAKIDRTPGQGPNRDCWEWQGSFNIHGYGIFHIQPTPYKGQAVPAHRLIKELELGKDLLPKDFSCHKCDNRKCVNPAHLFIGTHLVNILDMTTKNRQAKGSQKYNSVITEKEAYYIRFLSKDKTSKEICKELGIGPHVVRNIRKGKSWKHVTEDYYDK